MLVDQALARIPPGWRVRHISQFEGDLRRAPYVWSCELIYVRDWSRLIEVEKGTNGVVQELGDDLATIIVKAAEIAQSRMK